jgi:hypothetical protein
MPEKQLKNTKWGNDGGPLQKIIKAHKRWHFLFENVLSAFRRQKRLQ